MRTIIYHGGCPDGLTAAWLLQRSIGGRAVGYHHGRPTPEVVDTQELWIVDLSFPQETLVRWSGTIGRIFLLDHHATSGREHQDRNEPLETTLSRAEDPSWRGISITIDAGRSGCGLAAQAVERLMPSRSAPEFVLDVEDRDLWAWRREGSRQVCFSLDRHFQEPTFRHVVAGLEASARRTRDQLIEDGRRIEAAFEAACEKIAQTAKLHRVAGHLVPLVALSDKRFGSEAANLLLKMHPDAPFAGYYHTSDTSDGSIAVGLRSEDGRVDVSEVAERFGGGGHRNAAGLACKDLADLA